MTATTDDRVDVLIIGAGISGIGAARYLRTEHPAKTFTIVEARAAAGGTWDLFRYPGIRSDSDLHTFGYEFKPWTDKQAIADAPRILDYLHETIEENGLTAHIRYQHQVVSAAWSSEEARWQVSIDRGDTGERIHISARWIFCGSGYYDYDEGFSPDFAGRERFRGQIVHPQHWPEDLDYAGKRVVVIGSGATAVTLLPAMAEQTAHVTMLQRTPTYVIPLPREDAIANTLKKVLGDERGYALTRQKNVAQQRVLFELCQRFPSVARRMIRKINESQLPDGYPVDTHFNPPYNPWDQRLCVVPDADLFRTIRAGKASIVTDRIDTFTESGILLESGEEIEADIIVTATGLNIKIIGGVDLSVDGQPVSLPDTVVYRGLMLSGVPNFALAIGYTNASWTLKIGLLCQYFCKLLAHMDSHGYDSVTAIADPSMPTRPLLDFGAGYVQRALDTLPKQGPKAPWVMSMSYYTDRRLLRGDVSDDQLRFSRSGSTRAAARPDGQSTMTPDARP
ncbi:FAD-dependent oxidoreductase [Gordonia jinghuaiqii]|uniref:NAD(P)/FAD-dependent oxidoreductase n=1 Tax=Gordonia jinghuaiqii TaxID=2758710 RepID=A0A7D7QUH2_9ACTN|nr:NAD(P)/FAD-dependent oxidoreductase [Gordonia jinghuaiqii]MCR5976669.1 FAD-dependent oxidoreductase [Gordonia jinghuaiqii]QMS99848.1 NAD(P)/FAD-dependent oxidoreductase [Gordonia jinghuaiqii]